MMLNSGGDSQQQFSLQSGIDPNAAVYAVQQQQQQQQPQQQQQQFTTPFQPYHQLRSSASLPQRSLLTEHTHLLDLADIAANHARLSAMQAASLPVTNNTNQRASTSGGASQQQSRVVRHASDGSVMAPKPHTQRKYAKICTVCGDKALGYNFDAISCESCKAFFRRNAQKLSSLRCAYNDNCQIDKANRKLCRRCRLRKCFRVGMRIEYIQSEEQKQRKRDIVEQNRGDTNKRPSNGSVQSVGSNNNTSEDDDTFPSSDGPNSAGSSQQHFAQSGHGDVKQRTPSGSSYPNSQAVSPTSYERKPFKAEAVQYVENPNQGGWVLAPKANELTVEDCQLIDEAVVAWKNSLHVMQDVSSTPTTVSNGVSSQEDLLNVSEISFRRMVAMFKHIHLFRMLNVEDQKALLRGGALDLLIMRSALTYNPETHMFLDPTDDPNYFGIHSNELRRMSDHLIVDGLVKLVETLKLKLKVDDVMLILLLLVTLFSDDRPELSDKAAVAHVQERYTTALQHYIQTMRASSNGTYNVLFADLLVRLRELRSLSTTYETVVPFLKQWAIKPLMRELLRLMPSDGPASGGMTNNNPTFYNPNATAPGVDEDLAAAQQLFRHHAAMMASQNYVTMSMTVANSQGGCGSSSVMSTSSDQQQPQQAQSPDNPSSVISSFSMLADQQYDLPSVNVSDLP